MDTVLELPIVQQAVNWFDSLNLNTMDMILVVSLVASWGALVLALAAMKRIKNQNSNTQRLHEKLVHDLHIASSGAIGMGQRIMAMERKMGGAVAQQTSDTKTEKTDTAVKETKPQLKAVPTPKPKVSQSPQPSIIADTFKSLVDNAIAKTTTAKPASKPEVKPEPEESNPFDVAKSLLRKGVEQAEVARRCGLSLSETALMAMVLKNRDSRSARLVG